jgi:hypothetical protein
MKSLSLVEEVVVRLQRGEDPKGFEKALAAFLKAKDPKAPRSVSPQSDLTSFWAKLQEFGVELEDVSGNNEALDAAATALMMRRLFATPEEQIARLLEINEAVWKDEGVTRDAISALGNPPPFPDSDDRHLWCAVLLHETGDVFRTFQRNWQACVYVHGEHATKKDNLLVACTHVRNAKDAVPRKPGLRWELCELGRTFRYSTRNFPRNRDAEGPFFSCEERDPRAGFDGQKRRCVGQEGPLIAALHPRWAKAMNGTTIPFLEFLDLELQWGSNCTGVYWTEPVLGFDRKSQDLVLKIVVLHSGCNNPGFGPGVFSTWMHSGFLF